MRKVWKYKIAAHPMTEGKYVTEMPAGAKVLAVAEQRGASFIWAEIDDNAEIEDRVFFVLGTGHGVPDAAQHIATWQSMGGVFVWHLYEPMP